jgi:hypothetical protein
MYKFLTRQVAGTERLVFIKYINYITGGFNRQPPLVELRDDTPPDTPHSVGLLWTNVQPDAEIST